MKILILAAGEGRRMRPLTESIPKPLLKIADQTLLERHLMRLADAGFEDVLINTCYLGSMISDAIGDGARYGLKVSYLPQKKLLNTGGDTFNALKLLGNEPFIFISADIYTDFDYQRLARPLSANSCGRLIMVSRTEKHPDGCQYAINHGQYLFDGGEKWNWSSMGIFHPDLFAGCAPGAFPLIDVFDRAVADEKLEGEPHEGLWFNLGTPEDLEELEGELKDELEPE